MTTTAETGWFDAYLASVDAEAKRLNRMKVPELRDEHRQQLDEQDIVPLVDPQLKRDELISEILRLRFPRMREAYEQRAERFSAQEHARAINDLVMRLVHISDADLAEVLAASHPHTRKRLRTALEALKEDR
jgi:hypothetical protein